MARSLTEMMDSEEHQKKMKEVSSSYDRCKTMAEFEANLTSSIVARIFSAIQVPAEVIDEWIVNGTIDEIIFCVAGGMRIYKDQLEKRNKLALTVNIFPQQGRDLTEAEKMQAKNRLNRL